MGLECCQVTRRFCKLDLMVTLIEINLEKKKKEFETFRLCRISSDVGKCVRRKASLGFGLTTMTTGDTQGAG